MKTIDKNHSTHYSSTENLSQNPEIFTINQPKSKQDKDQKIFYKTHSVCQQKSSRFFQRPTQFLHRKPNPSSEKSKSENFIISTNPTPLNFFTQKPSRTQIIFPYPYVFLKDFLPKNLEPINPKSTKRRKLLKFLTKKKKKREGEFRVPRAIPKRLQLNTKIKF
jgi:hypothetical protein